MYWGLENSGFRCADLVNEITTPLAMIVKKRKVVCIEGVTLASKLISFDFFHKLMRDRKNEPIGNI